jgi:hypothetical protein
MSSAGKRLLGEGLFARARNASFALFGLSTAVGLCLVALALNQTWPVVPGLPIPAAPFERGDDLDAADATSANAQRSGVGIGRASRVRGASASGDAGKPARKRGSPRFSGAQQVAASAPARSNAEGPAGQPIEAETDTPPATPPPAPAPTSQPVATTPSTSAPQLSGSSGSGSSGNSSGNSNGKSHRSKGRPPSSKAGADYGAPTPPPPYGGSTPSPPASEQGEEHVHENGDRGDGSDGGGNRDR